MSTSLKSWPWPYPRWIAHRGGGKLAPENTLAAFRMGASYGYRMFECDVNLSKDGVPFLLHDATLDRTSTGTGIAGNLNWNVISSLDAGGWFSRIYAGEPVPRLETVAQFCMVNNYVLNIELKPTETVGESAEEANAIARRTGEVVAVQAAELWKNASSNAVLPLLSSFKLESLVGAKIAAPHLMRGLLVDEWWDGWLDSAVDLDCAIVTCNHKLWNAQTIRQVKAKGMRCGSYTVNEPLEAKRLFDLGIDCIYTDRLDLFSPCA